MMSPSKKMLLTSAVLLLAVLAVYSNTFHAQFHFDDEHQIVKNQHIRSISGIPSFFTKAGAGTYDIDKQGYRPLTYASFALNYALNGYDVTGYHVFNVALHFINAFLVFLIILKILSLAGHRRPYSVALTASLIFAVHPLATSAVTYISGRAAMLASFFWLLGLLSFVTFRDMGRPVAHRYAAAVFAALCYLLGLLSKEMAVSLPLMFLAFDLLFTLNGRAARAKAMAWLYYVPLAAVAVAFFLARKALIGYYVSYEGDYTPLGYAMSQAKALFVYTRLILLPVNQNADYYVQITRSPDVAVVLSAAVAALALYGLYRVRKTSPAATFFGLWFFVALAPESSFVPILDIVVEYRAYLPMAGFVAMAAVLADTGLKAFPPIKKYAVVAVMALLVLAGFSRNQVWRTEATLWGDVMRKSPESVRSYANYGNALLTEKRYPEAAGVLLAAIRKDPFWNNINIVHNNLGICYMEMGMYSEALSELQEAARISPGTVETHAMIGLLYYRTGRYAEALDALQRAAVLNPGYSPTHLLLAETYLKLGRRADALAENRTALELSPRDFDTNYQMAVVYRENGMAAEAIRQAEEAASLAATEAQGESAAKLLEELR